MTTETLGQRLARNIQAENAASLAAAQALAQQQSEEARKSFAIANRFFEDAKEFFSQAILAGESSTNLRLQVGGAHFSHGKPTHEDFRAVLDGYRKHPQLNIPLSLTAPRRLQPLWSQFQLWAHENGLEASWSEGWDGGGMDSWWYLEVSPSLPLGKTP